MADLAPQSSRLKRLGRSLKQLIVPRSEYVLDGRHFRSDGTIAEGGFSVVERVIELDPDGGANRPVLRAQNYGRCRTRKRTATFAGKFVRMRSGSSEPDAAPCPGPTGSSTTVGRHCGPTRRRRGPASLPTLPQRLPWSAATRPWAAPGVKTVANAQISSAFGVQPAALPRSHMPEGVLLRAFRGCGRHGCAPRCGLAHLDIKPQNILMRNDRATVEANAGGATLMDPGSACAAAVDGRRIGAGRVRARGNAARTSARCHTGRLSLFRVDYARVAAGERRGCGAVETAAAAAAEAAGRGRRPPRRDPASRPAPKPGVLDLAPCDVWSLGCTLWRLPSGPRPSSPNAKVSSDWRF